jgi:lipopolysaccharide biosynthesis glycosyltransferase
MKKVVFVLKIGDYFPELCAVTLPTIEAYAKKIGADLQYITERKFEGWPITYEKMQIHELGKNNDWNILIDADTVIHPDFVDVTTIVPKDFLGHEKQYFARALFPNDKYFERDGRNIGVAANFLVSHKDIHEIWEPITDMSAEEAVKHICSESKVTRPHIVDEFCLSRNLAKYGIKITGLAQQGKDSGLYHLSVTTENVTDAIVRAKEYVKEFDSPRFAALSPKSDKAIVTIAFGTLYEKMAEVTHPTIEAYAKKVGADFVIWRDCSEYKVPGYKKTEIRTLLQTYKRVLFIDTDILIREDAPNLFDIIPEGELGIFEEGKVQERRGNMIDYMRQVGFDTKKWDGNYYNTGVMMVSKAHENIFVNPPTQIDNFYEQTYLNTMIAHLKPKIFDLDYKFNRMCCMDPITGEERHDAYFIHYAGVMREKPYELIEFMKQDVEQWKKDSPEYKYKKNIALIVTGGMGDQIAAEPVARYIKERLYKNDNVIITTNWPTIFKHLELPTYTHDQKISEPGKYYKMHTLRNPEHILWNFMAHTLVHAVDWASICATRLQLPLDKKQIKLTYDLKDLVSLTEKIGITNLLETVIIHPGRGWDSKTFPADVWQSYIDILKEEYKVIVIGKRISKEQGVVEVSTEGCIDLIDKLSIEELIAIISQSKVLITNDSAPVHIAGAFDNWIGLIATCKHPHYILPYRNNSMYHKAFNLEESDMYNDYNHQPTQINGATIDHCTEKRMRECLPSATKIRNFVKHCFESDSVSDQPKS